MSTFDIINHPMTRGHINSMSVHELRELCRARHYPVHGDRIDLLGRIFNGIPFMGSKKDREHGDRHPHPDTSTRASGWSGLLLFLFFISCSYYQEPQSQPQSQPQPQPSTLTDAYTLNYIPVPPPSPYEFPEPSPSPLPLPPVSQSFTDYLIYYTTG